MKDSYGLPDSAIWLLADSNPVKWQHVLDGPLDSRFPTRHTIWTPILHVVQNHLFRECKIRLDDTKLYIRNAVQKSADKEPGEKLDSQIQLLRDLLNGNQPIFVLCFGQFAFECARRAMQEPGERRPRKWRVEDLATEFDTRISTVRLDAVNLLPLLHAIVALKFEECHQKFSGGGKNYFEYVGGRIARVLIDHPHPRFSHLWV